MTLSLKREVNRKKRQSNVKNTTGTGVANLEGFNNNLAGPWEYWVGNTSLRTDEEIVKEVLTKCAETFGAVSFQVLGVELLTKDGVDKSRTKPWRVRVPHKFKEIMMKDDMFPPGWSHRTFWYGRRGQERNKNKKEIEVVASAIKEREEEKVVNERKNVVDGMATERLLDEVVNKLPTGFDPELMARLALARKKAEGLQGAQAKSIIVQ